MEALTTSWCSPSNIALVKYWGKFPGQLPANPSISFTLKESVTFFDVTAKIKNHDADKNLSIDFFFEGATSTKFQEKIEKFLLSVLDRFPWLVKYHLTLNSKNTFPHSSGIASSASSMSALCLCLLSLDEKIQAKELAHDSFFQQASNLSRLASGSASRSVYAPIVSWGELSGVLASDNEHAALIDLKSINPIFTNFCDSIIIVDAGTKSVSSRAGHKLMENHPFKDERFKRARLNCQKILQAMKEGDLKSFIEIVEEEALMLHALMMTSEPSYILLKPNSLLVIEKLREFRQKTNIPVCFTIDAGPNIHVLYPEKYKMEVKDWLHIEFVNFAIIHDEIGSGPIQLKE